MFNPRMLATSALAPVALALASCQTAEAPPRYEATEASLAEHEAAPEWFRDAKIGIYVHWGPYSVPEYGGEWYPRLMYFEGLELSANNIDGGKANFFQHHTDTFGHPSEFNYHDLIPLFTAEKFDADEWADLFKATGAQFAGVVGEHHDGFSMWDSDVTPWNAADMGPKRDIAGLMAEAVRERDMKFIISFHHARNLQRYNGVTLAESAEWEEFKGKRIQYNQWHSHYPWIPGYAMTSDDPKLRLLYGNIPEKEWLETVWLAKIDEVVEKYEPDIIWFDSWLDKIPADYQYRFAANYLNAAQDWDKEVVITVKQQDMPLSIAVEDYEKGRAAGLLEEPFLTDDTISLGSWSYTKSMQVKSLERVMHDFIDLVSKNGQLLLNVSPRADGSIPDDQRAVLLGIGDWLKINGEAIYDTRPWVMYGEGPNRLEESGHMLDAVQYDARDVRFTTNGDVLYAIALGTPEGELVIPSLAEGSEHYGDAIAKVSALNGDHIAAWSRDAEGLKITLKDSAPAQVAYAFKIEK